MKWLRRGLLALAVLLLVAVGVYLAYTQRALPRTEGTLRVSGLKGEVSIARDAHGIPTIRAATMVDAAYGLGFVHAQDRLWQLETHRRIGAGQLAEVFGESALDNDRFLRALGVRHIARQQWEAVGGEARQSLEAYAAGINAFVRDHLKARPPEFLLLGLQPGRWEPADSLAWATMMAWDLGGNWTNELLRMRLSLRMPVERINELLPPYPGSRPLRTADYAALFRALQVDATLGSRAEAVAPESGVEGVGSNNWVVAGRLSDSGKPLLANDPHLRLGVPALWYLARLEVPGLTLAGATLPGLPAVVLGQNQHLAWGFTNTAPDVQDLYLEQIHPADPGRYKTPVGWAEFETREEVIRVKGGADVPFVARSTRHGPVISDVAGPASGLTGPAGQPTYALALRWTALDVPNTTVEAGLALNRASSIEEFVQASARHVAPMQNMVVADTQGRIGMVAAGRVPVRRPGHDLRGLVPAPGWEARYDWAGYLDPQLTPREFDPARGWIATANQRIHPPGYPHFITSEWTLPYRQQRIEQLLAARSRHSPESMAAMQADEVSLATRRLLPHLRRARSTHPLAAAAQAQLQAFDGRMAAERAAPLIFWAWTRHLTELLVADELGPELWERMASRSFRDGVERMVETGNAWWCDNKTTPEVETCEQLADEAFTRALTELQKAHGGDVAAWRWGDAHQARADHRPFSRVPRLARMFELRVPTGGDTYTVNATRVSFKPHEKTGELYLSEHAPSLRAVYDVGDPSRSIVMHSSGQSGLPFARGYRNFLQPWAEVKHVPLWAEGSRVLKLLPAAP